MSALASEYRSTRHAAEPLTLKGFDRWCDMHLRRHRASAVLAALDSQASAIVNLVSELESLSDAELQARVGLSQQAIRRLKPAQRAKKATLRTLRNDLVERAFALILELAARTLGKRPYPVQVMGALALYHGYAAQMFTGEGKTLTASLAACIAAWSGRPCHVITSNDYLAARDAQIMAPLYQSCGLTVAAVTGEMQDDDRRTAYLSDVVYATGKELLADYLRDQLRRNKLNAPERRLIKALATGATENRVMRGLDTAIVDEADSVLVDDALTPLIISAPGQNRLLKEASHAAHAIVNQLEAGLHYILEPIHREVRLTVFGEQFIDSIADDLPPLWRGKDRRLNILRQALIAKEFYQRDRQYIVSADESGEEKVIIVDEKTGRSMPGRSWSYGLHQAIEAKEGLPLSDPTETHVKLSFQRFFRRYRKLSGMSGTLLGLEKELWNIYRLRSVNIPSRCPSQRRLEPDQFFLHQAEKWQAVVEAVQHIYPSGQPILVGTRSIVESELLATELAKHQIPCQVLNAHHLAEEAQIIQQAGQLGMITIATNMAGRGTDILISPQVEALGGLYVIATERHESSRVDYQLFGRAARQGQPGVARAFVSLEDEIFRRIKSHVILKPLRFAVENQQKFPSKTFLPFFVRCLQKHMEAKYTRERFGMLHSEQSMEEMLSFVQC